MKLLFINFIDSMLVLPILSFVRNLLSHEKYSTFFRIGYDISISSCCKSRPKIANYANTHQNQYNTIKCVCFEWKSSFFEIHSINYFYICMKILSKQSQNKFDIVDFKYMLIHLLRIEFGVNYVFQWVASVKRWHRRAANI